MPAPGLAGAVGRPRAFDRDDALDRALELFWRNGFRCTTTRDLESELGVSQSSLYNTFGSKRALLAAAVERYEQRISQDLVGPLESSGQGLADLDEFFRALGRWVARDGRRGCMLINLMAEDGGATSEIAERTRGYRRRLRRAFGDALERAVELEEMSANGIDERAELLVGLVLGLNIAARGGASSAELRRLISAARYQIGRWHQDHV